MKMMQKTAAVFLVCAILLSLSACAKVPILKGSDFSAEYKRFIKNMCSSLPVSVQFEQYTKKEGFDENACITDTDATTIRELVNALANVQIKEQAASADNFAVRHYTFTDADGNTFTFEFYGSSYLKVEDTFYKVENTLEFISIRLEEKKSGEYLVALDEAYDGKGEYLGKMFLSCRELKEQNGALKRAAFAQYELSPDAKITAPEDLQTPEVLKSFQAQSFFADFEQLKGQENANYIFHLRAENGVIVYLEYDVALSASEAF